MDGRVCVCLSARNNICQSFVLANSNLSKEIVKYFKFTDKSGFFSGQINAFEIHLFTDLWNKLKYFNCFFDRMKLKFSQFNILQCIWW